MNKVFNASALILVIIFSILYRETLGNVWSQAFNHYFPCKSTITYSLGEFDARFGISKNEFLKILEDAESMWEAHSEKELFKYEENGRLKINLIYDVRQEATQELKSMGIVVETTKASYDSLKQKYSSLISEYNQTKKAFEQRLAEFNERKSKYEAEVTRVNSSGGANKATYNRLVAEREYLNNEIKYINNVQAELNKKVDEINAVAGTLNHLARTLNMNVDKFNTIGEVLGGEFEEGTYERDRNGERINIYQFDNRTKLLRVLAHEFGHALGLEHNEDPKAIMFRLNNGYNEKLTQTDIAELNNLCGVN